GERVDGPDYASPEAMMEDVERMARSLAHHRGQRMVDAWLRPFLLQLLIGNNGRTASPERTVRHPLTPTP
ncbi:hypothetical protein, partial [Alicyclobacillus acidocaldarius]|uniref:hypothetical protein n=1 Tax=Alicyclobacillus acidocaldarius TaxID=405212 RepID=UPI00345E95EA